MPGVYISGIIDLTLDDPAWASMVDAWASSIDAGRLPMAWSERYTAARLIYAYGLQLWAFA